jgi:anti-sigma B factor antagonist
MNDSTDDLVLEVIRDTSGDMPTVVVAAAGEIDTANNQRLEQVLSSLAHGDADVVVNPSAVTFMDSSGLRALLTGQRAVLASGRSFRVGAASDSARRVLEITGLADVLGLAQR